jgi:LSD1 subclass zinc finger protein
MAQTFNCPNCGAALEYSGGGRTMKCTYCGTTVQVPEELWQPIEQAQAATQWKKYLIIFLVVTVGIPTCVGLLGTVFGVGGSIFAALIPFVLKIFIR